MLLLGGVRMKMLAAKGSLMKMFASYGYQGIENNGHDKNPFLPLLKKSSNTTQ